MVSLYSAATLLPFFKFLLMLRRRDLAIGLVSGSSGLSFSQGKSLSLYFVFGKYESVNAVCARFLDFPECLLAVVDLVTKNSLEFFKSKSSSNRHSIIQD